MLSQRQFKIIHRLLTIGGIHRIKDLSDNLDISPRAIKYDLEHIRPFLADHNIELNSKPGIGVWVDKFGPEARPLINSLVKHMKVENNYFDQETRIQKIIYEFLVRDDFITAEELSQLLFVSRSTILKDIKHVGNILGASLVSKKGHGYMLIGREHEIRSIFEGHLERNLSGYDIYNIVEKIKSNKVSEIQPNLPHFEGYYPYIEKVIGKIYHLQPKNVIAIIMRFLVAITRIRLGKLIGTDNTDTYEEGTIYYYYAKIFTDLNMPIYADEIKYINGEMITYDIDFSALALDIIQETGQAEGFPYGEDSTLHSRLLAHLSQSLNEKVLENPFNEIIISQYPSLFNIVSDICNKYIPGTNVSFISYIVLHFLAARKNIMDTKKVKAVLVCASGRGAVNLIKRIIESEIKGIEVVANCSLPESEAIIESLVPDIVISVFPINTDIPTAIVESVPTKENLLQIKELCSKIQDFTYLDHVLSSTPTNAEDICLNVILLGLQIYHELTGMEGYTVKPDMQFAFLSHVMLFAQRYTFAKQYENPSLKCESNLKQVFDNLNINITLAELNVMLNYLEKQT